MKCTIFKNSFDHKPFVVKVDDMLERIRNGASKERIDELRSQMDNERQETLKKNLPGVVFSGEFKGRKDGDLVNHSGFVVLDFDKVDDVEAKKKELSANAYTYACWVSPRNNGLKVLVRVADGTKHRQHMQALLEEFTEADKTGINEARLCYESYDPEIFINKKSTPFAKLKEVKTFTEKTVLSDNIETFRNIEKWLTNKGDAFQTGERNTYIFKLASACCRFGIDEDDCIKLITNNYEIGTNKFSLNECVTTIKSAFRSNKQLFASAKFEKDVLVDTTTRSEVVISQEMLDDNIKPKDVIFGEDVKEEALRIFQNGYEAVNGIGVPSLDAMFKFKRGELTLLSGYGNYGKSTYWAWLLLMRVLLFGEKFAFFSPEENASEFYHNMVEMLLGTECTPSNPYRPSQDEYEFVYDFISKHIFYVYPKVLSPTPQYIKERFLELIIKEKVSGVVIDPFNQLTNDYRTTGGRSDKYLETFLSDCARFAQQNNIYFTIIAHPVKQRKDERGNYPCPDVFDIADGAMWNNKMDNIVIYDRPNHQVDPSSDVCEFHTKKIRRQKIVGRKGTIAFNFNRMTRRFFFGGVDYMAKAIAESTFLGKGGIKFNPKEKPKPQQLSINTTEPLREQESNVSALYVVRDGDEECPF